MQIFYINEDAPQPEKLSVNTPLHFSNLEWSGQVDDSSIKIPYNDINIVGQLGAPLTFVAWEQDVLYIDFEKSKAFLIVDIKNQKFVMQVVIYPQSRNECFTVFPVKTAISNFEVKLSAKEFGQIMWNLVARAA